MADVFISYSRKDIEFAKKLVNSLAKDKRDVWVDWEDIPQGEDWLNVIYEGIENADTFVFIVSRNSLISEICNYEVQYARENNKRIIPVIYERIEGEVEQQVKSAWFDAEWKAVASANWSAIGHINWVFPDNEKIFDDFFKKLIETIETDYAHVKAHTRYQVRALDWQRATKNPSFLLTGEEISFAEDWLETALSETKDPSPTALHQEYISESRNAEDARARRIVEIESRTRNARRASIGLIATLILGGIVALFIVNNVNQQANFAQETSVVAQNDANIAVTSVANAQIQEAEAIALADDAENSALTAQAQATQAGEAEGTAIAQEAEARALADDAENSALIAQAQATQAGEAEALALTQQAEALSLAEEAEENALIAQAEATQAVENVVTAQAELNSAATNIAIVQTQAAVADAQVEEANAELEVAEVNLVTATFVVEQLDTIQVTAAAINTQVVYSIATVTQSAIDGDIASTFGDTLFGLQNNPDPVSQISTMNSLVDRYPEEAQVYIYRALLHTAQDNFALAIDDYTRAIELNPEDLDSYNNRGFAALSLREYEAAIADLSYVIDNDTEAIYGGYTFLYRGIAYVGNEQPELALADFTSSIESDPSFRAAYLNRSDLYESMGNIELARQDQNRADAIDIEDSAQSEFYFGNIEEALVLANQAITLDPEYASAYSTRGLIYLATNQVNLAIDDLSQAIALDPEDVTAYFYRADTYANIGEFELAIRDFSEVIELDPENARAYALLGISYTRVDEFDLAIENLSQAIVLDPENYTAYVSLGNVYRRMGEFDLAIENLSQAIALNPENDTTYLSLGDVYRRMGEFDLAIENLSQAIALDPEGSTAYLVLGRVYMELSDFNRAIDNFTLAIETGYVPAYLELGQAYYELGEYELALESLDSFETEVRLSLPDWAVELREQAEENLGN